MKRFQERRTSVVFSLAVCIMKEQPKRLVRTGMYTNEALSHVPVCPQVGTRWDYVVPGHILQNVNYKRDDVVSGHIFRNLTYRRYHVVSGQILPNVTLLMRLCRSWANSYKT